MTRKKNTNQFKSVVVTGDVATDNYLYEGQRFTSHIMNVPGVRFISQPGGAALTYGILKELIGSDSDEVTDSEKNPDGKWKLYPAFINESDDDTIYLNSYSMWKPYILNEGNSVWRMSNALGYGDENFKPDFSEIISSNDVISAETAEPKILVIDDSSVQFGIKSEPDIKKQKAKWRLSDNLDWIVLKMTGQVAGNDLWVELTKNYSDKLIVIVSASELRSRDFKIAKGSSWEQTIEDTRNVLFTAESISSLKKCRHLILSFNNDGALWLNNSNRNKPEARLLCDTSRTENEWSEKISGKAFGYMTCLTSAIVYKLTDGSSDINSPDFTDGIKSGLFAMRNLLEYGHGYEKEVPYGFPFKRIANEINKPHYSLSNISIPWIHPDKAERTGKWMIMEMLQHSPSRNEAVSLSGLGTQVVLYGTKILKNIPYAKFYKHITADRFEIESLRRIRQFMIEYRDNPKAERPLSFGVFGPPGAGKSFGVKQIAHEVFAGNCCLEFNLSQFSTGSMSELYGALHQIRDKVLTGKIPVVFMDEFDSKNYEWLQYLLSPMQDGEFQEGQLTHTIGKCIFIFAGATSYTFESFGTFKDDDGGRIAQKNFILKKGPDFKSRLDTYLNVQGPNRRMLDYENSIPDPDDISYPLRRAIFISSKIRYEAHLPAQIDLGLINALLHISKYVHGARSLDKLLSLLTSPDGTMLERNRIPDDSQLSLYVNPAEFKQLLTSYQKNLTNKSIEELAMAIFKGWLVITGKKKTSSEYKKLYYDLSEESKEDNRAAARRIQIILATVNLKVEKITKSNRLNDKQQNEIFEHIKFHLELLSQLEHDGWWMQKIRFNWKFDEVREDKKKHHNLLKPYSVLPDEEKAKDWYTIENYQKLLHAVGYQINWIK